MNKETRPLFKHESKGEFQNPRAEEMRLKSRYRTLAMIAGVTAPIEALRGLIGPDCAYCLYRNIPAKKSNF